MTTGPRLYTVDEALGVSGEEVLSLYREFINDRYVDLLDSYGVLRHIVRAEGIRVWDSKGREYLDYLLCYGALSLGHNHPAVIEAVEKSRGMPNLFLHVSPGQMAACLASSLAAITPAGLTRSFFANSGSEAVEGALKLARASTKRTRFIAAHEGFHGKTFGALSVTGYEPHRTRFKPLLQDVTHVPFGDADALEAALKDTPTAAVILEPIQGPAGMVVPPDGYLRDVRALCDEHGSLMILDEIQTGFGRTGRMFACDHEDVVPDVLCLSKALSGGLYPIGVYVTSDRIWRAAYGTKETCLLHTTTFGGNTLACAAALAVVQLTVEEDLPARAAEIGGYFRGRLEQLRERHPLLHEVRGKGMMLGLDFQQAEGLKDKLTGGLLNQTASMITVQLLYHHDILSLYAFNNPMVIRLAPPLIVDREDLDRFVDALDEVLTRCPTVTKLAASTLPLIKRRHI